MEGSSFHSQMLSVMEVLAKAAAAEIERRVDDCCAVLRVEVSQSRRDIDALKRKCELMEAELRRSRARVRRKVFCPPASPLVRVSLSKETHNPAWDRGAEDEAPDQVQLSAAVESIGQNEAVQIKEEHGDDEVWKSGSEDKLMEQPSCFEPPHPAPSDGFFELYQAAEHPADAEAQVFPSDVYGAFPEQRPDAELSVKREEADENAAPLDPGHGVTMEAELSYARFEGCEQIPAPLASQSGAEDRPPAHPALGLSHFAAASAARVRRRARTFGFKRPQQADGHHAWSRVGGADQGAAVAAVPHPYGDAGPPDDDLPPPPPSRSGLGLARRMRAPWRPGVCEKRFACTYCDKSFMRFSQLKEHLRSHTGEKPFSCLQCGRSFTKQCNLIRHAVVHSGEKPYECATCGKCFTQRSSLKSHQKTAH